MADLRVAILRAFLKNDVLGRSVIYKTEGIIIKRNNLGEFDRLLAVYTKDFGKILIKAKSVRKNESKLRGHLELFLYCHLMIAPGRGFDIVTGAETIENFPCLRQNFSFLIAAHYLSELTDKLIAGPEKDKRIWQLLLNSFQRIDQGDAGIKAVIKEFENSFLDFLGYGQQKDFIGFTQGLLNEQIKSYQLLTSLL